MVTDRQPPLQCARALVAATLISKGHATDPENGDDQQEAELFQKRQQHEEEATFRQRLAGDQSTDTDRRDRINRRIEITVARARLETGHRHDFWCSRIDRVLHIHVTDEVRDQHAMTA